MSIANVVCGATVTPSLQSCEEAQGATEKKKKTQCTYVLYLARIELLYMCDDVIFFIAFLSSPHREALNQRNKKIERKSS